MATHFQTLKIREVRRETPSTVSIAFDIPASLKDDFLYKAGQYLTLRTNLGGEELRRSYSLCSSPGQDDYRVAIKEVSEGRFSTWANRQLRAGQEIEAMPPMGNFTVSALTGHHVAFAAGSGITPVISILRSVLDSDSSNRFTLFYGNKTFDEIIFRDEFAQLEAAYGERLEVVHVLSQEQRAGFAFGRLDSARLETALHQGLLSIGDISAAYLCGPSEMIFSLRDTLQSRGLPEERIKFELFTAPVLEASDDSVGEKEVATKSNAGATTTYIIDGMRTELPADDLETTVLDTGLAQGIDLPFACQGGVCCTCKAKVISGKVDMRQNFSLGDSEVAEGYVLTCQSYPLGEDTVIDYDS
jgi:ring-1,2-phenylacetyl-CoA epoxidase subunit PaaE